MHAALNEELLLSSNEILRRRIDQPKMPAGVKSCKKHPHRHTPGNQNPSHRISQTQSGTKITEQAVNNRQNSARFASLITDARIVAASSESSSTRLCKRFSSCDAASARRCLSARKPEITPSLSRNNSNRSASATGAAESLEKSNFRHLKNRFMSAMSVSPMLGGKSVANPHTTALASKRTLIPSLGQTTTVRNDFSMRYSRAKIGNPSQMPIRASRKFERHKISPPRKTRSAGTSATHKPNVFCTKSFTSASSSAVRGAGGIWLSWGMRSMSARSEL